MKFCFRLQLRKKHQFPKYSRSSRSLHLLHHHDEVEEQQQFDMPINECHQLSNNMALTNDGGGGGDDRRKFLQQIPTPVGEQQIANAQDKVDRLMTIVTDTYEKTLVRNLRLEELDMRSTDLFRDAEKMKNMTHKMQDKFFWENKYCVIVAIASVSAIVLGGLLALTFFPKMSGN